MVQKTTLSKQGPSLIHKNYLIIGCQYITSVLNELSYN